jgi:hypothetical protein
MNVNLETEVRKAWAADVELVAAKQAFDAKQEEFRALGRKVCEREHVITTEVKQRLGITAEVTDFELTVGLKWSDIL